MYDRMNIHCCSLTQLHKVFIWMSRMPSIEWVDVTFLLQDFEKFRNGVGDFSWTAHIKLKFRQLKNDSEFDESQWMFRRFCYVDSQTVCKNFLQSEQNIDLIDVIIHVDLLHLWNVLNAWGKIFWRQQQGSYLVTFNDCALKSDDDNLVLCIILFHNHSNLKVGLPSGDNFEHDEYAAVWDFSHKKLIKTDYDVCRFCVHQDCTILDMICFHFFIVWVVCILIHTFHCVFRVSLQHFRFVANST